MPQKDKLADGQLRLDFEAVATVANEKKEQQKQNVIDLASYSRVKNATSESNSVTARLLREAKQLSW